MNVVYKLIQVYYHPSQKGNFGLLDFIRSTVKEFQQQENILFSEIVIKLKMQIFR